MKVKQMKIDESQEILFEPETISKYIEENNVFTAIIKEVMNYEES